MLWARRGLSWIAEALDVVAELGERRGGRGAGQAGADDDDVELRLLAGLTSFISSRYRSHFCARARAGSSRSE